MLSQNNHIISMVVSKFRDWYSIRTYSTKLTFTLKVFWTPPTMLTATGGLEWLNYITLYGVHLMKIKQMNIQTRICKIVIMLYMRFNARTDSFFIFNDKELNLWSLEEKKHYRKSKMFSVLMLIYLIYVILLIKHHL